MKTFIVFSAFFLLIFSSLVYSQQEPLPGNIKPYIAYQDDNRTVYVVQQEIPSELFEEQFGFILERLDRLEAKESVEPVNYLPVVNLVLIVILFILLFWVNIKLKKMKLK